MSTADARRAIPAVDRLLASEPFQPLLAVNPRPLVVRALQEELRAVRAALAAGDAGAEHAADPAWYAARVEERLAQRSRPSLRTVINATGVVLHTNLGRAVLADAARLALDRVARAYSNLEYDLDRGERGSRYDHCAALLTELTGAEAALVVNNNAAALVLALNTLALGREAIVSRGELVEIGDSFRIAEIMERSGVRLVEVGATNRTHRRDYEQAFSASTAILLKVHRSNFRMSGFTSEVPLAELVSIGRARGVPVLNDLGSGLLVDGREFGLPPEPTAMDALRAGADLVTMSGDKLLGGPQAGVVLGRRDLIQQLRRNPLCRALRVDKLTLAALEATLALYRDPAKARREIPTLRMLALGPDELAARARAFADRLRAGGVRAGTQAGESAVGGGAYPDAVLPTTLVTLDVDAPPDGLARRLREGEPPVVARIQDGHVVLDLRTVAPEEEDELAQAVTRACT
jgi:L-seryl-tRNA(Ser) seleniumtransferase